MKYIGLHVLVLFLQIYADFKWIALHLRNIIELNEWGLHYHIIKKIYFLCSNCYEKF